MGGAGITKLPLSWGLHPSSPCLKACDREKKKAFWQTWPENELVKKEGGEGRYPGSWKNCVRQRRGVVASDATLMGIQIPALPPTNSVIFSKWITLLSLSCHICKMGVVDTIPKSCMCVGGGWGVGGHIMRINIRIGPNSLPQFQSYPLSMN